jgi:hypothetical protein
MQQTRLSAAVSATKDLTIFLFPEELPRRGELQRPIAEITA